MDNRNSFKALVDDIEKKNKKLYYGTSLKNPKSKLIDYLTPELCCKLAKCIDIKSIAALQSNNNSAIEIDSGNNNATENDDDDDDGKEYNFQYKKDETMNDNCKEQFEVHIQPASNPRQSAYMQRSWMANYLRKPRNDRIMWESKLYKFERSYNSKSLPEKTEELMDLVFPFRNKYSTTIFTIKLFVLEINNLLAAGDFADWLKSLGSDDKVNMNKDSIKKLFSIGIEDDVAKKALYVAPIIKSAIPEEIANIVRLPDLAIEKKVDRILLEDKQLTKTEPKYIAFGRTLPPPLKLTKFEIEDRINKPNFPENLRSNQIVFDGITHLRSTKILKEYIDKHPGLPMPTFLMEAKGRKGSSAAMDGNKTSYTPLYKIANRSKIS